MVSSMQPLAAVALVAPDGTRYPAAGIALVSGPHVLYNPPPSVSLGIGGFGFSGCCSAFGSGGRRWTTGRTAHASRKSAISMSPRRLANNRLRKRDGEILVEVQSFRVPVRIIEYHVPKKLVPN
jgi:hypothetical protein